MIKGKFEKILFIGLGGAGQRHLRIFSEILPNSSFYGFRTTNKTPTLNKDFTINKSKSLDQIYNINFLNEISEIDILSPDLTVISVPSSLHLLYTKLAHSAGSHVLVEKPGCISKNEFNQLKKLYKNSKYFYKIGFQRRYHPLYELVKSYIGNNIFGNLKDVNIKVSSFIPDWHPYENYLDLYACRKDLGGGVLTTECHELNIMIDLFGQPIEKNIKYLSRSKAIKEVSDSLQAIFQYDDFSVDADISFFRKPQERKIKFIFDQSSFIWDIDNQNLDIKHLGKRNKINLQVTNDDLFKLQAIDTLRFSKNTTINSLKELAVYTSFI